MKINILFLLFIFFISNFCIAAKITFHDGSILEAKIIDISDEKLILEYNDNTIERSRHEIASISNIEHSEQILLNQIEKSINRNSNIQKSAYETLNLLKEKLQLNCEEEKQKIIDGFKKEKLFLEKNLELLAIKYAALNQDFENTKLQMISLNQKLSDQKIINENANEKILKLKNEINALNEEKLKNEVTLSEKIQEAITKNKKLMENEKFSIIDTYEAQLSELQKQLNESNLKSLKLVKENADISEKLINSEKLSDQNGNALLSLEKEFENYKITINKEISEINEKAKNDKSALEKLLNQSAEKITDNNNEIKMLKEKLNFKEDELLSANNEIQTLKKELQVIELEKEKFKQDSINAIEKQKEIRQEIEETQQKVLKSLIDKVMLEDDFKKLKSKSDSEKVNLKELNTEYSKEEEKRLSLYQIFQDDLTKITKELEDSKTELNKLKDENLSLKSDIEKSEIILKDVENKKQDAENKAKNLENEKEKLKKEVEEIISNIKEETKKELEAAKSALKEEALNNNNDFANQENIIFAPTNSYNTKSNKKDDYEIKELPFDETEKIDSDNDVKYSENQNENSVIIEVGSISQIEKEFSRIFIDTTENLKEKDQVYVKNNDEDLVFTVLHIYTAINGAVAETKSQNQLNNIKIGDKVFIK